MEKLRLLREAKRVEVLGDGEGGGVRIVKLSDFISGGSRWTSKQTILVHKSIEPRGIGTLESGRANYIS